MINQEMKGDKVPRLPTPQEDQLTRTSIMAPEKRNFMEELRTKCFDRLRQQRSDLIYKRRFSDQKQAQTVFEIDTEMLEGKILHDIIMEEK